jgi:hypothetical protein
MAKTKRKTIRRKRRVVRGSGIVSSVLNKTIDLLPVELHIPGYQYCGPGTKLKQRLARGDPGINKLDQACKQHDIAYSRYKDSESRRKADKELAERAWQRFKAPDASYGEKAASWAVTTAMKAKTKFGGGRRKKRGVRRSKRGRGLRLRPYPVDGMGLYLSPYKIKGTGNRKKRCCKKKRR